MRHGGICLGLLIALVTGAASAKAPADKGRALYDQGEAAFMTGNFVEAATLFEQAFAESQRPEILWNIAQANRRQYDVDKDISRLRRARHVYENFAEVVADPKSKEDATREAAVIDVLIKEIEKAAEDKAAAEEASRREAARPFVKPVVNPAPVPVMVAAPAPTPVVIAPPPPPKSRTWIYVTAAAAVVVVGVGVGLALALSSKDPTAPSPSGGLYTPTF